MLSSYTYEAEEDNNPGSKEKDNSYQIKRTTTLLNARMGSKIYDQNLPLLI